MHQATSEGSKQPIRELIFNSRKSAEEYLSTIATCVTDVRFREDARAFQISYAGGPLERCALHRAKVLAMTWTAADCEEVHIVMLQRGTLTVSGGALGKFGAVAQRTAMLLMPRGRGEAEVADGTTGVSVIAAWPDVRDQARRLLGREPSHSLRSSIEARSLADPVLAALERNASAALQEMVRLTDAGLSGLARAQLDDVLMSLLAATLFDELRGEQAKAPEAGSALVRRARDYIRARAADPMRLTDLASELGVGMRSLQIAFRKQLGMSPREYLMSCRLELARARLVSGDRDTLISAVAFDSGFTDLALFSRKYRQAFGELPSATLRRR